MSSKNITSLILLQNRFETRLDADLERLPTIINSDPSEPLIKSMLAELESEFSIARDRNDKIVTSSTSEAKQYTDDEAFEGIRTSYHRLYAKLMSMIPKSEVSDESNTTFNQSQYNQSDVKLNRINLPIFNGAYEDWIAFDNLFTATIDKNTSMDPVIKLQRLKAALTGEAELIVKNLPLTAANYTVARTLLSNRYQHTRRLVNAYLKKIYELPTIKTESSKSLKTMINTLNDSSSALRQLKLNIEDYQLVYHMCRKLPQSVYSAWEESQGSSTELPSYAKFNSFLETRFRMLEMVEPTEKSQRSFHITSMSNSSPPQIKASKTSNSKDKRKHTKKLPQQKLNQNCIVCNANHRLGQCENFLKLPQSERLQAVKSHQSCVNCLSPSHRVETCWSTKFCRVCKRKHHTLLHRYDTLENSGPSTNESSVPLRQTYHLKSTEESGILLGTAQLRAINPCGYSMVIRALIDPCSEDSYILSTTAQTLQLKKYYSPSTIGVLGEENSSDCCYRTDLILKSLYDNFEMKISVGIVNKITSQLPSVPISVGVFEQFSTLSLADSTFNEPGFIHMLLGVEVHTRIRLDTSHRLGQDLIAENTLLGYLIRGKAPINSTNSSKVFMTKSSTNQLLSLIKKFWELEEVNVKTPIHPDDALCEQIFRTSVHQDSEGFLTVDLPFKEHSDPHIGPSRPMAVKRFLSLEKKLKNNPELRNEYHKTINNYLVFNHLHEAPFIEEQCAQQYYLPHHAVVKESSSTTKVRVVFDASCKSYDGSSLNDHLLTGSKLQKDIRDVLFNWRQYPFSLTGDIEKMYLMFKINSKHHNYQRIVWRFDENQPIKDFVLTRATFGTSCAPFIAMRCLHHIADIHEKFQRTVSTALRNDFYVDDFLSGGFSIKETLEKQTAIRSVLKQYNLTLRKWSSNHPQTLSNIPDELLDTSNEIVFEENEFKKTLGIFWSKERDAFFFSINPLSDNDHQFTKRQVLSLIARLYDPLGWVSPCTLLAKHLMQKVWQTKTDWDEVLEEPIYSQFRSFFSELPLLKKFSIPRWTNIVDSQSPLTIFGFCDASDKGYSAVVYLMNPQSCNNKQTLILLTSKTKVADLKFQSTARLELNGAVMLSELLKWTADMYKPRKVEIIAFCDSQIVLAWLNGHPSRWKTYIANRTSQILEWMQPSQWHYIDTKLNPADCASRGLLPSELITNNLWIYGPNIDQLDYNQTKPLNEDQQNILDDSIKRNSLVLYTKRCSTFYAFTKFSNHDKLVRIIRFVTSFIINIINNIRYKPLTKGPKPNYERIISNFNNPEWIIFRCIQREVYNEDIKCIEKGKQLARESKIKGLSPFIDAYGLLRVGGRLHNSDLTYAQKHPIIMPPKHQVITNLIQDAHQRTMHGSVPLTLAFLRQQYHIPRASQKVRYYIHSCMKCFRYSKKQQEFLMGSLPKNRVCESNAFEHSGVDFAGPVTTKAYPGRCKVFLKSYIALFVCLCTKAIHLEVVSDLSSKAFLAGFKRFVATRGMCHKLYSDNGTNFVGANRILQQDLKAAENSWKTELNIDFKSMGTEWHFIPPATPHFGGLWEAGVKSVKMHLNKTIGSSILTFEELNTVLKQIEAVLNSRPLCKISDNPDEFNFLTPGHFLVRKALVAPPEKDHELDRKSHLDRWNHVQLSVQRFSRLWKRDYLNNLQNRPKGLNTSVHYRKGELVLLADDDVPPTLWPTLIIEEVHPGTDNVVRVVTLRSSSGKTLKRPVTKLRRLPCNSAPEL